MMTVIAETTVKSGRDEDWDRAFHERAADARKQPGWIDLHLLVPVDDALRRVVVGTWVNQEAWERWHETPVFIRTREVLDAATQVHGPDRWFTVVEELAAAEAGQGTEESAVRDRLSEGRD